jgi:hypothetical protein
MTYWEYEAAKAAFDAHTEYREDFAALDFVTQRHWLKVAMSIHAVYEPRIVYQWVDPPQIRESPSRKAKAHITELEAEISILKGQIDHFDKAFMPPPLPPDTPTKQRIRKARARQPRKFERLPSGQPSRNASRSRQNDEIVLLARGRHVIPETAKQPRSQKK